MVMVGNVQKWIGIDGNVIDLNTNGSKKNNVGKYIRTLYNKNLNHFYNFHLLIYIQNITF